MSQRPILAVRAVYGVVLLVVPRRMLAPWISGRPDSAAVIYARVLGSRQLAEAIVLERHPSHTWAGVGAAVDAIHALSALALLALKPSRPHRRELALNAATATALAAYGARRAR